MRELQNALERAVVVAASDDIRPEDLPRRIAEAQSSARIDAAPPAVPIERPRPERAEPKPRAMQDIERAAILEVLDQTRHNISEACRVLGIPRTTMYRKLKRHRIPTHRDSAS